MPEPRLARPSHSFEAALRFLAGQPDLERGDVPAEGLTLDRIRALLQALGRPDARYPSVLIAGTKGKGSTAAMIERALRAAGHRTGLYTQPHLHSIRERIRLDGLEIEEGDFADGMEAVRAAAEHRPASPETGCTAYEILTALALERFATHRAEVVALEVGLGGRLDATNAVDAAVSVLTSISLDHTQILGDTVEAIAREKADIIKSGRPCVSAPQTPAALQVIKEFAQRRGSDLRVVGEDGARWEQGASGGWDVITSRGRLAHLHLALRGGFQRINAAVAATALEALETQGVDVPLEAVRIGLEQVIWPGRLEYVRGDPPVVLDGAHNLESARRLREALREEHPGFRPLYVLGIAADKDVGGIVGMLCAFTRDEAMAPEPVYVVATAAHHPRALAPEGIARAAQEAEVTATVAPSVAEALRTARRRAVPGDVVVVTGSLHVVGEAREALGLAEPSGERAFDPWTPVP